LKKKKNKTKYGNNFRIYEPRLPDKRDKEFIDCISGLDTPKKIGAYMLENFVNCSKKGGPTVRNPYGFWKIRKGNCVDFSEFGAFVATYHGYKVYQLGIIHEETQVKHLMTIYAEDGGMSFTSNQDYFDNYGNWFKSFKEIKDFICASHPPGYQPKEFIIKRYDDSGIKWSGRNYIN